MHLNITVNIKVQVNFLQIVTDISEYKIIPSFHFFGIYKELIFKKHNRPSNYNEFLDRGQDHGHSLTERKDLNYYFSCI